MREGNMKPALC